MNARHLILALLSLPILFAVDAPAAEPQQPPSLQDIIQAIPVEMLPEKEEWTEAQATRVNEWVQANYAGKPIRPTLVFFHWKEPGRVIHAPTATGRRGSSARFGISPTVTFSTSREKEIAVTPGKQNRVTVEGQATLLFRLVSGQGRTGAQLVVTMTDPKIFK